MGEKYQNLGLVLDETPENEPKKPDWSLLPSNCQSAHQMCGQLCVLPFLSGIVVLVALPGCLILSLIMFVTLILHLNVAVHLNLNLYLNLTWPLILKFSINFLFAVYLHSHLLTRPTNSFCTPKCPCHSCLWYVPQAACFEHHILRPTGPA